MKKNISKFIVLLLSASILVGCGKGESNSTEVHKSEKVTKGSQGGEEKKVDREDFKKGVWAYIMDENKDVAKLMEYAKERKVLKKVQSMIGVWL